MMVLGLLDLIDTNLLVFGRDATPKFKYCLARACIATTQGGEERASSVKEEPMFRWGL